MNTVNESARLRPTLAQIAGYFLKLGCTGFGGPVALANYMRKDLVEQRRWIDSQEYDEGLAIATACPGPLAYQLGVYCGYLTHGITGAIAIAIAFALGPFVIVCAAAFLYVRFGSNWIFRGLFYGIDQSSSRSSSSHASILARRHCVPKNSRGHLRWLRASSP